jgi:hypothetical protein
MVGAVRPILKAAGVVALSAVALALSAVPATAKAPTQAQIRSAVRRAERSKNLWATVNICNSKAYPDYIGIRGQMPALGFAAWLSMDVRLYYYSSAKHGYAPIKNHGSQLIHLGRISTGLQQSGARFQFAPHEPTLEGKVTFIWRRAGKLLGQVTKTTTSGHHDADYASPKHYSAATCKIA